MRRRPACLITTRRIKQRIKTLGRQISADYRGRELVVIGVLKGSFIFLADLVRNLTVPVTLDFIQVSSYGTSSRPSGRVKVMKNTDLPLAGRDVLIVEDIIDYGYTIDRLIRFLKRQKPRSIKVCALLDKPARRRVKVPLAYRGFTVPDKFIVGYGLDFSEKLRNLPYIGVLPPNQR
jgi:hypoxanthine phosphoribosyltransferase